MPSLLAVSYAIRAVTAGLIVLHHIIIISGRDGHIVKWSPTSSPHRPHSASTVKAVDVCLSVWISLVALHSFGSASCSAVTSTRRTLRIYRYRYTQKIIYGHPRKYNISRRYTIQPPHAPTSSTAVNCARLTSTYLPIRISDYAKLPDVNL